MNRQPKLRAHGANWGAICGAVVTVAAPLALSACAEGGMAHKVPVFSRTEQPCRDMNFPIYFDRGSDQLTAEARALLSTLGTQVKGCRVRSSEIVGLSGIEGDPKVDLDLSRRRGDTVARALASAGLPAPKLEVLAEGASGAVSPSGRPEPLRRRAEVILHLAPL